jgi:hypothetical protein
MKRRFTKKNITTNKLLSSHLNSANINYYSKTFKNTKLIPKTNIINYMFSGFNQFIKYNTADKYALDLDDCFIINKLDIPVGLKKNDINLILKMNPKTPLDKLITYSFYLKQSYIFEKNNSNTSDIKYQIGKDIKRSDINVNGNLITKNYRDIENNYNVADLFYQTIIDNLYQINRKTVNLNIANKIALLSCQNVFNLITDLITIKLNDILSPETNSVFRPDKYNNIIINQNEISMELGFDSQLIISRDGEPMDPEYPCGKLSFILYIDFKNNFYELKKFNLDYDISKCGPEIINNELASQPESESSFFKKNFKPKYIIPAALVTSGIIAAPFILGALGGNKPKKSKKVKKSKKSKIISVKRRRIQ